MEISDRCRMIKKGSLDRDFSEGFDVPDKEGTIAVHSTNKVIDRVCDDTYTICICVPRSSLFQFSNTFFYVIVA